MRNVLVRVAFAALIYPCCSQEVDTGRGFSAVELDSLKVDDACSADEDSVCAVNVLQRRNLKLPAPTGDGHSARSVRQKPFQLHLYKQRRRSRIGVSSTFDIGTSGGQLEGAAWADYAVDVDVSGQTFRAIVDTGSSTFAVAASPLDDCVSYYTGACTGPNISAQYGSGSWAGYTCQGAEVSFAGLSAGRPSFVGITSQNQFFSDCGFGDPYTEGIASDGIVGMAYQGLVEFNGVPLFESVVRTTGIPDLFSLQCCGWRGEHAAPGQLVLGAVVGSLHDGEIQYTPITLELYYCVNMLGISSSGALPAPVLPSPPVCHEDTGGHCFFFGCDRSRGPTDCRWGQCRCWPGNCAVGGACVSERFLLGEGGRNSSQNSTARAAGVNKQRVANLLRSSRSSKASRALIARTRAFARAGARSSCGTIIDSGTSEIVLAEDLYRQVMGPIEQAAHALPSSVSCVTAGVLPAFPDVLIELEGGVRLTVGPRHYFQPVGGESGCHQLFIGNTGSIHFRSPNIIGQVMMEAYYTVFDRGNRRVGFAPIAGC